VTVAFTQAWCQCLRTGGCRTADQAIEALIWQAVAVPRTPEQIQQEIDAARESLGATLDELAFRTNPKRLSDQAKEKAQAFLQSPPGIAIVSVVGLTVTFVVTRKIVRRIKR
jgi:hypothetical protein